MGNIMVRCTRLIERLKRTPWYVYAIYNVLAVTCLISIATLYPGLASYDSVYQWMQVKGVVPMGDWHPVVAVLFWKFLYVLTGKAGSVFVVWQLLFWGFIGLLLVVSIRRSRSVLPAVCLAVLAVSPLLQPIIGTIWKDVQLAIALLGVVAVLWYAASVSQFAWWAKAVVIILLIYAGLIRHNALVAVLPLLYIWVAESWPRAGWQRHAVIVTSALVGIVISGLLLSTMAVKQHPTVSVMLDDIVGIRHASGKLPVQTQLQARLERIAAVCHERNVRVNVYFRCMHEEDRHELNDVHHVTVKSIWIKTVTAHPLTYLQYRIGVYKEFLFGGLSEKEQGLPDVARRQYVVSPNVISLATEGTYTEHPHSSPIVQGFMVYSYWFAYGVFSFLFRPWFWLMMAVLLLALAIRCRTKTIESQLAVALAISAILYIASYIPVVVATDYRYILWSVIAVWIGYVCLLVDYLRTGRFSSMLKTTHQTSASE